MRGALIACSVLLLVGCAEMRPPREFSYKVREVYTTPVGEEMIWWSDPVYTDGIVPVPFRKVLMYGGKSGDTIKVQYREFINGNARPAFNQELTYDLKSSDTITFRKIQMKVISSDSNNIRFAVVSDDQAESKPTP